MPALPRDLDRAVGTLVVGHPSEEQHVGPVRIALAVADRKDARVDPVVDDTRDGDVGRRTTLRVGDRDERNAIGRSAVEVGELVVEGTVDGGGDRETRVVLRMERAHHGVVVDDVAVAQRLVGMDDVSDLGNGHPDTSALGGRKRPLPRYRAGRITRREQQHIMTLVLEATGELVDHELDAAIEQGRNRGPGRRDDADAHAEIQSSRAHE